MGIVVQRAAVTAAVEPDATELGEVIVTGSLLSGVGVGSSAGVG